MGGFTVITGDQFGTVMNADNASFDGTERGGVLSTNGQLWIGSTLSPRVKVGTLTSPLGSIVIGYSSPDITLEVNGSLVGQTITGDSGGPLSPTLGNWNIIGGVVAAGAVPVATAGAGSTLTINVQTSQAIASTNAANIGLSAFNSAHFTVDANGFVSANGAGLGQTITGNTGGALSPTLGNWNILGTSTNGIQSAGAASTSTVRMQSPYADADFSFESQAGGVVRTLTVQNTVNAASSGAILQVGVAGTSSADPFYRSFIGTTKSYAWGQLQSDTFWRITTASSGVADLADTPLLTFDEPGGTTFRALFPIQFMALAQSVTSGTVDVNVQNSDNTMTDSNARVNIQVAGDSGGDPFLALTGGSWSSWSLGVANSVSDVFRIFRMLTPSTTSNIYQQITTAGEVTFPATPAFLATHTVDQTNITGSSTLATINFTTEVFDQNADYDGTNTFTAPVSGRYLFNCSVFTQGYIAATSYEMRFNTSNRVYRSNFIAPLTVGTAAGLLVLNHSIFADMDALDTCSVQIRVVGEASDIIDSLGEATLGYFGGSLQC